METLLDAIECFIPGDWGNENFSEDTPNKVVCIRGADIDNVKGGFFRAIPQRYVSNSSYKGKTLNIGDIVIEKSGGSPTQSTGRVCYISEDLKVEKNNIVCSNFCAAFRLKDKWFYKYVYYYLQNIYNQGNFFNFEGKTSGIRNLLLETAFKAIPLPDIDIKKQIEYVSIIDEIDKKIILNTRMNAELEAMAKQLYDYWFVQFDFPDENGKPYKSSGGKMVYNPTLKREIPAGWEACTLGDFCDLYQPKTIGTDEMSKNGKYHVYGANGLIGFYDKYNHEKSEIVMACRGNSCGAINRTMPFSWITGNAMVLSVKDKSISNEFISQCTNYMNIKGAITGSGQPQLTRENLAPLLMIYPLQNILKQFSKKVTPIIEHRLHIQKTNEYLTHFRDSLLPMLMNGQVTVE